MTDLTIPFLAPGCFGSALLFKSADMVCRACPMRTDCEPKHIVALARMRDLLGIVVPDTAHKPQMRVQNATPEDNPTRMALPKKVFELMERIDRGGFDIVAKMKAGLNPFPAGKDLQFMRVACHVILNKQTAPTQGFLETAMTHSLHHSPGTASAHARMAIQALVHVGAVELVDGLVKVRN